MIWKLLFGLGTPIADESSRKMCIGWKLIRKKNNGNIATGQLCETCLNAQHVSLESFLVTGPIPETNHGKYIWPHSIGNAQTIQNCCPYVFIFLQLTSFAQDLLCCKFNPFPYQIVLHLGSKKLDHHIIGGIRPISSDQIPTNSPLDCYYWSTKSPCSTKKKHGISCLNPHELPIWLLVISPCSTQKIPWVSWHVL